MVLGLGAQKSKTRWRVAYLSRDLIPWLLSTLLFPVHGKFPSHVFLDILIFQADVFAFLW